MTIVFNANHFNTIIYTTLYYVPSFMQNKPNKNYFMLQKEQEMHKKPLKRHIASIFKHMIIVFNSKHFNTIINTK